VLDSTGLRLMRGMSRGDRVARRHAGAVGLTDENLKSRLSKGLFRHESLVARAPLLTSPVATVILSTSTRRRAKCGW
jgi:hypothetical protein